MIVHYHQQSVRRFCLTNRRIVQTGPMQYGVRYDLLLGGSPILTGISSPEAAVFVLTHARNTDLFQAFPQGPIRTGAQLRTAHNRGQAALAQTHPEYHPIIFSHEPQEHEEGASTR